MLDGILTTFIPTDYTLNGISAACIFTAPVKSRGFIYSVDLKKVPFSLLLFLGGGGEPADTTNGNRNTKLENEPPN